MATDRQRAAAELRAKLEAEAALGRRYLRASREAAQVAARAEAAGERQPEGVTRALMEPILRDHHDRVGRDFAGRSGVELDRWEELALGAFLLASAVRSSDERAERLGLIADRDLAAAEAATRAEAARTGAGAQARGVIMGSLVLAALTRRATGVATFETQAPAEQSKGAAIQVALGRAPDRPGQAPPSRLVMKEWVSQGDSKVRPWHLEADGQQVPVTEPFRVGPELLMHPGDRSLGASAANLVNCRCSAVHDVDAVDDARESEYAASPITRRALIDAAIIAADEAATRERARLARGVPAGGPRAVRTARLRRADQAEAGIRRAEDLAAKLRRARAER